MTTPIPDPTDVNFQHIRDDVDRDDSAHHHTLGAGPTQAAPGNHNHNTLYDSRYLGKTAKAADSDLLDGIDSTGFVQKSVADTAWHLVGNTGEPAFQNGWANMAGGEQLTSFRKDVAGVVHLRGLIKSGTIGTVAFTLPIGYRPGPSGAGAINPDIVTVISSNAFGRLAIYLNGDVIPQAPSVNTWVSLASISFLAEQ